MFTVARQTDIKNWRWLWRSAVCLLGGLLQKQETVALFFSAQEILVLTVSRGWKEDKGPDSCKQGSGFHKEIWNSRRQQLVWQGDKKQGQRDKDKKQKTYLCLIEPNQKQRLKCKEEKNETKNTAHVSLTGRTQGPCQAPGAGKIINSGGM